MKQMGDAAMPTKKKVAGEWSGAALTGGCPKGGNVNWRNNPQYALIPSKMAKFEVTIAQNPGSSMLPMGLLVLYGEDGTPLDHPLRGDMIVKGGKSQFKATDLLKVVLTLEARHYIIVPSTFEPGMEGAFTLKVASTDDAAFLFSSRTMAEPLVVRAAQRAGRHLASGGGGHGVHAGRPGAASAAAQRGGRGAARYALRLFKDVAMDDLLDTSPDSNDTKLLRLATICGGRLLTAITVSSLVFLRVRRAEAGSRTVSIATPSQSRTSA